MAINKEKELVWVGRSKKDLKSFPEDVQDFVGFALDNAQFGDKHPDAKPLNGGKLQGKGIFEVVDQFDGDTYRAVYTVKLEGRIYVLHTFMKKSHKGKETPKHDIELIADRYKDAIDIQKQLDAQNPSFLGKYLKKYLRR